MEWIQKGRPRTHTNVVLQQHHSPMVTNAMVIYSAPVIAIANSFATLNNVPPNGLRNEDVQEDLLARVSMGNLVLAAVDPTHASPSSPSNHPNNSYDTCMDGATASEYDGDSIENFTNDSLPLENSSKK